MKILRKQTLLITLSLTVVAVGSAIWLSALNTKPQSPAEPLAPPSRQPQVEVTPIQRGEINRLLELTGEAAAVDTVVIAAIKEGVITFCPWREGDEVGTGEKLIEIDREVQRAEVQTAQAALAAARAKLADMNAGTRPEEIDRTKANVRRWQATLAEARKGYERRLQLAADDYISRESVDQAQEHMAVAEAELAAARETLRMLEAGPTATELMIQKSVVEEAAARLALAEAHLAECVIPAPFDGIIAKVHVRAGDLAIPRTPLLVMYDPASLVVRFAVSEAHAASVRPGQRLQVMFDAFPGQEFSAQVTRVHPQLDETMRTRAVEAQVEEELELLPGMFARLWLPLELAIDALIVPTNALIERPGEGLAVMVVRNDQVERVPVSLGVQESGRSQVFGDLTPGELVVVSGQGRLQPGAAVEVRHYEAATQQLANHKPLEGSSR